MRKSRCLLADEYKKKEEKSCIFGYFISSAGEVIFKFSPSLLMTMSKREAVICTSTLLLVLLILLENLRSTKVETSWYHLRDN